MMQEAVTRFIRFCIWLWAILATGFVLAAAFGWLHCYYNPLSHKECQQLLGHHHSATATLDAPARDGLQKTGR